MSRSDAAAPAGSSAAGQGTSSDPDTAVAGASAPVRITQMGCPMHLSECPPRYDHAGYPEGYPTEEVLQSLGYSPDEIRDMT